MSELTNGADNLPYKLCEQIKDDGVRCGAPALSGKYFCRFHFRASDESFSPGDPGYALPILDTEQSVQIALQQVMRALLSGKLSERKAAVMMSAIKTAAHLIRQTNAGKPREALLNEIATELRGRAANKKPPQPAADPTEEDPAANQ